MCTSPGQNIGYGDGRELMLRPINHSILSEYAFSVIRTYDYSHRVFQLEPNILQQKTEESEYTV